MNPIVKLIHPSAPAAKFSDPDTTASGERRASVTLTALQTLWFSTGTLCNIACNSCYIESSPTNDRLMYLTEADMTGCLDEADALSARPATVAFTGGELFMNPAMPALARLGLMRGFDVLILTNAMRPMMRPRVQAALIDLNRQFGARLNLRVSLDHWRADLHDEERGAGSFSEAIAGLRWLRDHDVRLAVAARLRWGDSAAAMRAGFARLFARERVAIDADDHAALVLFPEMDTRIEVPEITVDCWRILNKHPQEMMCATSRVIVKRNGAAAPAVVACTLLPYEDQFELGAKLADALGAVKLNHPYCAQFCVLGGGSCST